MPGRTVAMINGHRWYWQRARHKDVQPGSHLRMRRWFLRDNNDWVGDFGTKREMLAWIDSDGAQWLADYSEQPAASTQS